MALVAILALLGTSCGEGNDLIVGASTSVQDTGLLDDLTEAFREESGYDVAAVTPIVAASGQILDLARRGEVDAVITHSPAAEAQFVAEGDGIDRRPFMYNFFLVVGPEKDPAGVNGAGSAEEALKRIAEAEALFLSRGDGSGTNIRELALWQRLGIDPEGQSWYQESGVGQGQSLLIASDKDGYSLVDSGTFTVFRDRLELAPFVSDDEPNEYSVIRVNPEAHDVKGEAALAFADFLTSETVRKLVEEFGRESYGEALFMPGAAQPAPTGR